jgi:putative PIG3 family NAD(P)H quinone oxidoreductase
MKAVLMQGSGGIDVLKIGDIAIPKLKDNQVLVKVMAASINRPDLLQRIGLYPPPSGESEILGLEVAGVIEELGPGVSGWNVGEKVMSLVGGGGYAQYAAAYAPHLIPIPENMTYFEAACICESYTTAFLNIFLLGEFKAGQTALLHGGGGGVNTAGIQLCKALAPNCRLIITAAPEKMERVKDLGADLVINYKENPDFSSIVLDYTNRKGVDVILDHVGAKYLAPNMTSLAINGRLVVIGFISGFKAELNLALIMMNRQRIIGSVLRPLPVSEKGEIVAEFIRRVLPELSRRTIVPIIEEVFPLDDVADAHRMMEEDRHFGKIVLQIGT